MRNAEIGTLDPAKLTREDHIDISGTQCVRVSDRYRPDGDARISAQLSAVEFPHALFPPHTAGFLYYYQHPPPAPPCAGEIRFRITPNVDPVGFPAGRDLTLPSGLPWHRPLIGLEKKRLGRVRGMLYPMLQRDGLVSPEVLALASNLKVTAHSTVIHSFGQPFEMALNSRKTITILGRKEVAKLTLRPFILRSERRGLAAVQQTAPYLGTAICHFQRTVSLGWRDTLSLRVEKYVEGPTRNPDFVLPRGTTWADFPPAQAGELVRLHTYYMLKPRSKEVGEREVGGRDMQRPFWLRYSHRGESKTEAEEECEGETKGVRRPFWLRYSHQGNMALRLLLENEPPDS
ncbi:hypothetical protein BD413DRAFT_198524 [Trametes elegans]|nr:hypothetical protein BD413DRAFT_198524 [Trametes elegans]